MRPARRSARPTTDDDRAPPAASRPRSRWSARRSRTGAFARPCSRRAWRGAVASRPSATPSWRRPARPAETDARAAAEERRGARRAPRAQGGRRDLVGPAVRLVPRARGRHVGPPEEPGRGKPSPKPMASPGGEGIEEPAHLGGCSSSALAAVREARSPRRLAGCAVAGRPPRARRRSRGRLSGAAPRRDASAGRRRPRLPAPAGSTTGRRRSRCCSTIRGSRPCAIASSATTTSGASVAVVRAVCRRRRCLAGGSVRLCGDLVGQAPPRRGGGPGGRAELSSASRRATAIAGSVCPLAAYAPSARRAVAPADRRLRRGRRRGARRGDQDRRGRRGEARARRGVRREGGPRRLGPALARVARRRGPRARIGPRDASLGRRVASSGRCAPRRGGRGSARPRRRGARSRDAGAGRRAPRRREDGGARPSRPRRVDRGQGAAAPVACRPRRPGARVARRVEARARARDGRCAPEGARRPGQGGARGRLPGGARLRPGDAAVQGRRPRRRIHGGHRAV